MPYTSDKRLYLNADRTSVVEEDSAEAAYLLVNAGGQLSDSQAKQYGLSHKAKADPADERESDAKQVAEPPENKAKSMKAEKAD